MMAANDWKQKCGSELKLEENKLPMPDTVDWKSVYEKKPLGRNLLKNPSPFGTVIAPQLRSAGCKE